MNQGSRFLFCSVVVVLAALGSWFLGQALTVAAPETGLACPAGDLVYTRINEFGDNIEAAKGHESPERALADQLEREYPGLTLSDFSRSNVSSNDALFEHMDSEGRDASFDVLKTNDGWQVKAFEACNSLLIDSQTKNAGG